MKTNFIKTFFLLAIFFTLPSFANAANLFNWGVESNTTSIGNVLVYNSGTTRDCTVNHSGACSMRLQVIGNDGNNQQMGVDLSSPINYGWSMVNSKAIYYRWWMKMQPGFSWGSNTAKTKSSRVISGTQGYTGYLMSYGFLIGECDGGGCTLSNGSSNSADSSLYIPYDFRAKDDGVWHEYIVKIKPNTLANCIAPANCDAQFQAWVDGVSVGQYNNFKLHNNASDQMSEAWGDWMVKPYFQLGGTVSDGGTIYLDDFSTDDAYNSIFSSPDSTPPVISNGAPLGTLAYGTTSTLMSVDTNENATCKYGTSNVAYASLPYTFSTTGGTSHSKTITALTNGNSYEYYVRCIDEAGNANTSATVISFSIYDTQPTLGECQDWQTLHPDWIFCDDFEDGTALVRSGRYFEYDNGNNKFTLSDSVGFDNSKGMKAVWNFGDVNLGNIKVSFGRNPISSNGIAVTQDFREVYYRQYLKNQTGWIGNPGKLSRASVFSSSLWSQAMAAHLWGDATTQLLVDPTSCVIGGSVQCVGFNDFSHLQWIGSQSGSTPIFDGNHNNQWYCIESHVKLNNSGQSDGVQEFWIDGNLEARRAGLNFTGTYVDYGINAIFFENYWNAGAPKTQERYFDNIVISTQPIGCLGVSGSDTTPPAEPTGLGVY